MKQVATFVSSFFHSRYPAPPRLCFLGETRRIYERWRDERGWTRAITLNPNDARECLILLSLERKMKYSSRRGSSSMYDWAISDGR